MSDINKVEYKLHSHGDNWNWFHFRKNIDSIMESFSVTYCHDGTVVMTGDYGCLAWRRHYFGDEPDYGFPGKLSGIGYFAEKVVRAEEDQKIKTWKRDLAVKEIEETIKDEDYGWTENHIKTLKDVLDRLNYFEDGEYGYIQMLEAFYDSNCGIECETFCEFGQDYTDNFKWRYAVLTSVSARILQSVRR